MNILTLSKKENNIELKPYVFKNDEYYIMEQTIASEQQIFILRKINLSDKKIKYNNVNYFVNKKENNITLQNIISSIEDIKNFNLSNSKILNCSINNLTDIKKCYKSIINEIYNIINDGLLLVT
jgi:hypothetical protein